MRDILVRAFLFPLLITFLATPASAQEGAGPLPGGVYRLEQGSGFAEGCVDPCDCAVVLNPDLRGIFRLTPDLADPLGPWIIDEIRWLVTDQNGLEVQVRGRGSLTFADGTMRMRLHLRLNDAAPVVYDSGPRPADGFPLIRLEVRIPGAQCITNWFRLDAAPVPDFEEVASAL